MEEKEKQPYVNKQIFVSSYKRRTKTGKLCVVSSYVKNVKVPKNKRLLLDIRKEM